MEFNRVISRLAEPFGGRVDGSVPTQHSARLGIARSERSSG
jgi:hypothetical protein